MISSISFQQGTPPSFNPPVHQIPLYLVNIGVAPVQAGDVLEVKMRPIGSPRQILVKDKQALQSIMSQSVYSSSAGNQSDEQTARAFLNHYRSYLRLDNPDSELSLSRQEVDGLNRHHIRFNQQYQGLRVWSAELIVHLDAQGSVDSVDGGFIPTPKKLVTEPVIDAGHAVSAARTHVPGSEKAAASQPELIIYGALDRPARLAWKLELDISIASHWIVVVDALTGEILTGFDNVQHENVSGSGQDIFGVTRPLSVWRNSNNLFYLEDTSKPMFDPSSTPPQPNTTKGAIIITDANHQPDTSNPQTVPSLYFITSNGNNSGWLPDGVSAAFNLAKVYDYYL